MKCIDCKYFWRNHYDGMPWCDAWKKSKRIQLNEEYEDIPCSKGEISKIRNRKMKIVIEIPTEFEDHFKNDRFKDSLLRLIADADCYAGNYEKETADMLIHSFENSQTVEERDKELEEKICSLPKILSSDGQDYVQLYDVLRTIRGGGETNGEVPKDNNS